MGTWRWRWWKRVRRAVVVAGCVALTGCGLGGEVGRPSTQPPRSDPWSTAWTAPGPSDPSVLAADVVGVVAVGAIGEIRCYFPNGQERWTTTLLDGPVYWRPALAASTVVVSLGDRVAALDRATGALRWQQRLADPGRLAIGPAADGVETVVVTGDSYAAAYRVDSGALRWGVRFTPSGIVAASVSVSAGRAFVALPGTTQSTLYALDLATGQSPWRQPISLHASEPVVGAGQIIVAERLADGSRVRALDLGTGETRWTLPVTGTFLPGYEAAADDRDYAVADDEGEVLVVDLAGHSLRWKARAGRHPANLTTTLLVGRFVLVTGDGHGLVSIDRQTGRVLHRDPDREVLRSVVSGARAVYALSGVGTAGILRRREP